MNREKWKDIEGYEGFYRISNIGRVMRVEKETMQWNHQLQKEIPIIYPKRYLKFDQIKGGYNRVTLSLDNKQKRFIVHRLVAKHFVENPENKPHVHHINNMSCDNRADNLMWVTPQENEYFKHKSYKKSFEAISPEGEITVWHVQMDCARRLGLNKASINRCLNGKQESYRGWHFRFIRPLGE